MSAKNDCAIVIIAHQNKGNSGNDLHRVFGSVDITSVARSVLQVSESDIDPETKIVTHIKSSLSRPEPPLAFRIESNAPIKYLSQYEGDFDDIPVEFCKSEKATEIILSMLADSPCEGKAIIKACEDSGISERTVQRIKKELGIRSGRDELNRRVWILE
jgi:hypothetical protein